MKKSSVKERPALLELLNTRASWNLPPFAPPTHDAKFQTNLEAAARAHARANLTDPWSYSRIKLHMQRGLDLPSDVLDAARKKQ